MDKVKIRNRDIWSIIPNQQTPMLRAFSELAELQIGRLAGMTMARIARAIRQQEEDIDTQRRLIVEKFKAVDEETGEETISDEGENAFLTLLNDGTFEVEALPLSQIHNADQIKPLIFINLGDLLVDDLAQNGSAPEKVKRRIKRS